MKNNFGIDLIKAVLFDLDMTLIDFMRLKEEGSRAAANAMVANGLRMNRKTAANQLFNHYLETGIESNTAFSRFLRKHYGKANRKMLRAAVQAYTETKQKFLRPYPNVKPTLKKLKKKGIKLGVISDGVTRKARRRLEAMGVLHYFDLIITEAGKPSTEPFLKAMKKLKLKPEEILMVGDWPERDIAPAKKIGMATCLAKYGQYFSSKGIKADWEIKDIRELADISF